MKVKHYAKIIVGDYQFAESLNQEVLYQLKFADDIGHTNVKASVHTDWNWLPNNQKFINFKSFILTEIEKHYAPGSTINGNVNGGMITDLWGNIYRKGDYTESHNHWLEHLSVVYFLKAKFYHAPLIFESIGLNKKIRPKEGRLVIFPSFLTHSVPIHKFGETRITLAANLRATGGNRGYFPK